MNYIMDKSHGSYGCSDLSMQIYGVLLSMLNWTIDNLAFIVVKHW